MLDKVKSLKDPMKVFAETISYAYQQVPVEKGWKVLIHGQWNMKKDGNRTYASKNAAKNRTENELSGYFHHAFYKEFKSLYDSCIKVSYPNGLNAPVDRTPEYWKLAEEQGLTYFRNLETKSFRAWMNMLYQNKAVEYVEIPSES